MKSSGRLINNVSDTEDVVREFLRKCVEDEMENMKHSKTGTLQSATILKSLIELLHQSEKVSELDKKFTSMENKIQLFENELLENKLVITQLSSKIDQVLQKLHSMHSRL
jgi:hypothetical protein